MTHQKVRRDVRSFHQRKMRPLKPSEGGIRYARSERDRSRRIHHLIAPVADHEGWSFDTAELTRDINSQIQLRLSRNSLPVAALYHAGYHLIQVGYRRQEGVAETGQHHEPRKGGRIFPGEVRPELELQT